MTAATWASARPTDPGSWSRGPTKPIELPSRMTEPSGMGSPRPGMTTSASMRIGSLLVAQQATDPIRGVSGCVTSHLDRPHNVSGCSRRVVDTRVTFREHAGQEEHPVRASRGNWGSGAPGGVTSGCFHPSGETGRARPRGFGLGSLACSVVFRLLDASPEVPHDEGPR